jgi:hypothetical protein
MLGPFCSAWKTPTRQIAIWARTATIFAMCSVRWSTPSSCWPCQRTTPASATPCSAASSNGTSDGIGACPVSPLMQNALSKCQQDTGSGRRRSCTYVAPAGELFCIKRDDVSYDLAVRLPSTGFRDSKSTRTRRQSATTAKDPSRRRHALGVTSRFLVTAGLLTHAFGTSKQKEAGTSLCRRRLDGAAKRRKNARISISVSSDQGFSVGPNFPKGGLHALCF